MSSEPGVSGATKLAAVIGWPVEHSLSPVIHNAGFAANGIDAVYLGLPVPPGRAADAVDALRLFGWLGLSVTMPHKADVMAGLDDITDAARALGAVNCVFRDGDRVLGDNTDGAGWVNGLRAELGVEPGGAHVVVMGAGGAARAVVRAAADAGADRVTVINRSADRAAVAAELAGPVGRVGEPADLSSADVVVNATPIGMADTDHAGGSPFDVAQLRDDAVVSELIYHPSETPLLRTAAERGLRHQNGLAMLVHQAVVAFEHWTDTPAPVETMTAAATAAIG